MPTIQTTLENIVNSYHSSVIYTSVIITVLFMVLLLSVYEFLVYRLVSHRAFYNRAFHTCIAILPFFISTIILCLQSNIVITLGTIGALAIIRFRTAVKDPVDMLYLLWSIHIGITCGCQLYEVAVLTSLMVTVMLIVYEHISIGKRPFVLVLNCSPEDESKVLKTISEQTKKLRVKSRNFTDKGLDMVLELSIKSPENFSEIIKAEEAVKRFSLIEYDSEDII